MKADVNKDICIGCGACTAICPNVFEMDDDGHASVKTAVLNDADKDSAKDAAESCPVGAITTEE